MTEAYYIVYAAADVDGGLALEDCITIEPRYSLDGSHAVLAFSQPGDGSITHDQALELMATEEWSDPTGIPQ